MNQNKFLTARRQSGWAIIFIILRLVKRLALQSWPILLGLAFGRTSNTRMGFIEWYGIGIGILGTLGSILAYFRFYYSIDDNSLIIKKGIIQKINLDLPYERIQRVNIRRNILHSLLGVASVEVESAGSKEKELIIDAISMEDAYAFRDLLLEKKSLAIGQISNESVQAEGQENHAELILKLSHFDLFKIGLTRNHLKLVGILFGLSISIFFYSRTLGISLQETKNFVIAFFIDKTTLDYLMLVLMTIPILLIYSLATTFIKYYDLHLSRAENKFLLIHGLFNRIEHSALDSKIQQIDWQKNILEKRLGINSLTLKQATSDNTSKANTTVPGVNDFLIRNLIQSWLGESLASDPSIHRVSIHFFYRFLTYTVVFYILLMPILLYFKSYTLALVAVVLGLYLIIIRWLKYNKLSYHYDNDILVVRNGTLGERCSVLPLYKIQNLRIVQNYYQWSRDLATIHIYSAAGVVSIPYIKREEAQDLLDLFLYKAERNPRNWM